MRRRPGRCTEDKFVFVSWAVTLSGRTLTRSCQREGRRELGAAATLPHSCGLIPPTGPPATQPIVAPRGGGKPRGAGAFLYGSTARLSNTSSDPAISLRLCRHTMMARIISPLPAGLMDGDV
ncbi:hypothetical protein ROHU_014316 [Labeo rohita]|uniref:Uncharacterized protein n=1 Tax=Labeo rohita TaxID=84645 RepID=A0A498NUG0_LABRO|nr:hypothetical protein ROHU_014316 [Labeo rohita]